jgi:4-diphosphocytidyl-2-C-methyl-D-erythritol kinase
MGRLTLLAPAKLNLRLLVGPLAADGYHPVRTLMVALDGLADRMSAETAERRRIECPGVEERRNLAWAALDALEQEVGRPLPLRLTIEKAIPSEAGLGGGSSDAAAALVAADRLHGLGLGAAGLERVAARVGSDVPFFVRGGAQWGEGRGERLRPGRAPAFGAVLLRRQAGLPTPAVYRAFDRLPPPPPAGEEPAPGDARGLAVWVRNDLWPAALALRPGLGGDARALRAAGARAVVLCGSGSCVAGLFADAGAAREAAGRLPAGGLRAVVTGSAPGVRIAG